jgi:hypothetical protein
MAFFDGNVFHQLTGIILDMHHAVEKGARSPQNRDAIC